MFIGKFAQSGFHLLQVGQVFFNLYPVKPLFQPPQTNTFHIACSGHDPVPIDQAFR